MKHSILLLCLFLPQFASAGNWNLGIDWGFGIPSPIHNANTNGKMFAFNVEKFETDNISFVLKNGLYSKTNTFKNPRYYMTVMAKYKAMTSDGIYMAIASGPGIISDTDAHNSTTAQIFTQAEIGIMQSNRHSISMKWLHLSNGGSGSNLGRDFFSVGLSIPVP